MTPDFKRQLADATRLTRAGDLAAATRSIREALGAVAPPPPPTPADVDVEPSGPPRSRTREHPFRSPRAEHRSSRAGHRSDAAVIDGQWSRVDERGADGAPRTGEGAGTDTARAASSRTAGTATDETARKAAGGTAVRARHVGRSRELDYRVFVPPLAAGAPPPALVVMLHGCTQDAEDFAIGTGMDALALEHGFVVLYPEQSARANPQRCWNWFKDTHQRRGQGEPALIEGAIREVVDAYGIDIGRVFVAGLSAGGAMAAILGDTCPELVRAVGVHSGLAAGAARDMPGALAAMRGRQGVPGGRGGAKRADAAGVRRPPTIVFHGESDRTVHPENGEHVVAACLASSARVPGEAPSVERLQGRDGGRGWTRDVHRDANGAVVAEHWRVSGAAHAWSGGDARGSWTDAEGPDASAEMVRFFLAADAGR